MNTPYGEADEDRVERLRESNRKLVSLVRLASGDQVPEEVVDNVIALAREDLIPGDLGDEDTGPPRGR